MEVAFFGGSFDPPHLGHVLAAAHVLSTAHIDKVLCVPVHNHAFAKPLSDFEHRLAMTRLAMEPIHNVLVSDIESELPAPNYTLHTLRALGERCPEWKLRLMVGSDVFAEQKKWQFFEQVVHLAPPLVLPRAGVPGTKHSVLPEVSSSKIREILQQGDAGAARLATVVPHRVLEYIETHGLYRSGPASDQ